MKIKHGEYNEINERSAKMKETNCTCRAGEEEINTKGELREKSGAKRAGKCV